MSNSILTKDNMTEVIPKWQHPILPGRAVQGSLLFTTTDFINPPQSAADFTWIAMEEICGIHDTKCYYDEKDNVYHFYKSIGHLNNDETWAEDWYEFASVQGISKEAQEMLETMEYIVYKFNQEPTEFGTHFTVVGVRKDMSEDTICDMYLPDKDYIDRQDIKYQPIDGDATSIEQDGDSGGKVNVLVDNDTITINDNNELVAEGAVADEYTIHKEDGTHIISVIPNRDKGIDTSVNGVEAKVDNNTIDFNADGQLHSIGDIRDGVATHIGDHIDADNVHYKDVDVLYDVAKGLTVNGDNQLEVKKDYNKGLEFNNDGELAVKVDELKGLTFNDDDGKLAIKHDNQGLEFDEDGNLKARVDGATVRIDDYGRLEAVPVEVREGKAIDIRKVEDEGDPYYVIDAVPDGTTAGYDTNNNIKVIPNEKKGITTSIRGVEAKINNGLVFDTAGNINVDPDENQGIDIENGLVAIKEDSKGSTYFNDNGELCADADIRSGKGDTITTRIEGDDGHRYSIIDVNTRQDGGTRIDGNNNVVVALGERSGLRYITSELAPITGNTGIGLNANYTIHSQEALGDRPSNIHYYDRDSKIAIEAQADTDELTTTHNTDNEITVKLAKTDVESWTTNNSGLKVVGSKTTPNGGLQINTKAESPIYLKQQTSTESASVDVRTSKGIDIDTSTGYGYLTAKLGQGLRFGTDDEVDTNAIKLDANFTTSDEPLDTAASNVVIHSDGKLEFIGNALTDEKSITKNEDGALKVKLREHSLMPRGTSGLAINDSASSIATTGLYINTGNGLNINEDNKLEVKAARGLTTDDNKQVILNTNYYENIDPLGTQHGGLALYNDNKVGIATNFTYSDQQLGTIPSKLKLYSDGKIDVDVSSVFDGTLLAYNLTVSATPVFTSGDIKKYKWLFVSRLGTGQFVPVGQYGDQNIRFNIVGGSGPLWFEFLLNMDTGYIRKGSYAKQLDWTASTPRIIELTSLNLINIYGIA